MRLTTEIIVIVLTTTGVLSKQVRKCKCDEIEPCKQKGHVSVVPCADKCKNHVIKSGTDYAQLRECIKERAGLFAEIIKCVEDKAVNPCVNDGSTQMIEERYKAGFEIAAAAELNSFLKRSGVNTDLVKLFGPSSKLIRCIQKCMAKTTNECSEHAQCGLELPSDNEIIANARRCAIEKGFDTDNVQGLCNCAFRAGMT
ncbi:hypothetical protein AB6A40_006945 [Gnathostoma spinigerum]|uniref:Uncharacterized protein n=1 Tax=Gnathostoma spinigerum TaxID=75299 RepID=A0ABD6ELV1_9BILA